MIVIDGTDGSGKATQTKLLVRRLRQDGYAVRTIDFPQYNGNFFGRLLGECLRGEHGNFVSLDPHITSVLYASDRFESKKKILKWLSDGAVVILDRYVSANQIHQGGKIANVKNRTEFLRWLDVLEYEVFGIPRPDLVVYLSVPADISTRLLMGEQKKSDVVEKDENYVRNSVETAQWLCRRNAWQKISCVRNGVLRSVEDIHEEIFEKVSAIL